MADGKKSFVLYCDLLHTVELLEDLTAGKLMKHLLRYVNDLNPETDDMMVKVVFEHIKRQLKRDLKDWEDTRVKRSNSGHLGGIKSGESRKKKQIKANEANALKSKQIEANEAVNVTVNVNDTVNSNTIPNSDELVGSENKNGIGVIKQEKEKKKVAPKKKGGNLDSEPYWHDIRKKWVMFNKTYLKFNVEPIPKRDYSHMHRIIEKLRERAVGQSVVWNQENALTRWEKFLTIAYTKHDWLPKNFELGNLESKMQTIFNLIDNPNGQHKSTIAKPANTVGKTIEFDKP